MVKLNLRGLVGLLGLLPLLAWAQSDIPDIAVARAGDTVALAQILNGQARVGFDPVLSRGVSLRGDDRTVVWLRLHVDLPEDGQARVLRLDRQEFESLRLYGTDPDRPLAQVEQSSKHKPRAWADSEILPLPDAAAGAQTYYLRIKTRGGGWFNLQPTVQTESEWQAGEEASAARYRALYLGLLLLFLLAMYRHWRVGRHQGAAVAALACLLASAVGNGHFRFSVGGIDPQGAAGTALPYALWIVACGPLLWAATLYGGLDRTRAGVAALVGRAGWALLAAGLAAAILVPSSYDATLQILALAALAVTSVICVVALILDPRQWRWGPIAVCALMLPALAAIVLAHAQRLEATFLVRRGFEQMLALLVLMYVLLPWVRQALQQRAMQKRAVAPELTAEQKIARAREQLMAGLQSGLANADAGDLEWIAYRRLLEGLKPVLPQVASAVVAMNYHNEDLLQVEPRDATDRYKLLLQQRGSMLKRLSKVRAPQQVSLDFDGPEGPLPPVQLAMIPLPIDAPGWGALLIERLDGVTYSEQELDLCAEFASLATTAGDEAAEAKNARHRAEYDAQTGVYRRETIDQHLARLHAIGLQKNQPLALLRLRPDNCEDLEGEELLDRLRAVVGAIREELDYGELIGRYERDEFVVLAPERSMGEARDLAERIRAAVARLQVEAAHGRPLTASIGISLQQPSEKQLPLLLERTEIALRKARDNGGDQAQAVATTTV